MNKKWLLTAAVLPLALTCGCEGLSHTENGALAGGGIGAVTGALIGGASGHAGGGALIGAGAGALAGGLIGNSADKSEQRAVAAAQARQLGLTDVAQLSQQHISDTVIVGQIRSTGSVYRLSSTDIVWLKENGVSDYVINEMQATAYRYPHRVYTERVYVAEPPPVDVGVGVTYVGGGGRWR
ncbi:MAG TPA: glycine zipper domain-containing protein [Gemmataceae bacterium]|nr:glycine zipper domain-containing protein [Gemmataceae bacterium]